MAQLPQEIISNYIAVGIHIERRRVHTAVKQVFDDLKIPADIEPAKLKQLIESAVLAEITFNERGKK